MKDFLLRRRSLFFPMAALFTPAIVRAQGKKSALVVGNANYTSIQKLSNPALDGNGVAAMLDVLGFRVRLVLDASIENFRRSLIDFSAECTGSSLALMYYAGHGLQFGGENYLVPIDVNNLAANNLVPMSAAIKAMARAPSRVLILDACRENPFRASPSARTTRGGADFGATGSEQGLARVNTGEAGTLLIFSTSPGRIALDGPSGANSPFTDALLDVVGEPGLEIRQTITRVRRAVVLSTSGSQIPWDDSSLTEDIILRPNSAGRVLRPQHTVTAIPPAPPTSVADPLTPPPSETSPYPQPPTGPFERPAGPSTGTGEVNNLENTYRFIAAIGGHLPLGIVVRSQNSTSPSKMMIGGYAVGGSAGESALIVTSVNEVLKTAEVIHIGYLRALGGWVWLQQTAEIDGNAIRFRLFQGSQFVYRWSSSGGGWRTVLHGGGDSRVTSVRFERLD